MVLGNRIRKHSATKALPANQLLATRVRKYDNRVEVIHGALHNCIRTRSGAYQFAFGAFLLPERW